MRAPTRWFSPRDLQSPARMVLFFVLFYLWVWLWVEPQLIHHAGWRLLARPILVSGARWFGDQPPLPGGAAGYLAGRLSHFYYYPWAGALIITLVAWSFTLAASTLARAAGVQCPLPLQFAPAILLLLQHNRYGHYLDDNLALLAALAALCIYARAPWRNVALRGAAFLLLAAVVYAVGAWAYLVFATLGAIWDPLIRRDWAGGFCCLVGGVLAPAIVGTCLFDLAWADAYFRTLPVHLDFDRGRHVVEPLSLLLLSSLPLAGLSAAFWRSFCRRRESRGSQPPVQEGGPLADHGVGRRRPALETLALLALAGGCAWFSRDQIGRQQLRIDAFAARGMWSAVLSAARELPDRDYTPFVCHDVNRALYHSGRLAEEMFAYPQKTSNLLLTSKEPPGASGLARIWAKNGEVYYELGHVNAAEHITYDALTLLLYYPAGLKRMALINIVKKQPNAARTFLQALGKDFLHRAWAERYLERLEADPSLSADREIQKTRSLAISEDSVREIRSAEDFFLPLLQRNRHNRMAFEYLMALHLLNRRLDQAAANMSSLGDFDYPAIPRHYEEAILLHLQLSGQPVDLGGRRIRPETTARFRGFCERWRRCEQDQQGAAQALARDYGDTYYYFHLFGASGRGRARTH